MRQAVPVTHDIVLVGGGHSHVAVIKSFGMKPAPGARVTVVSREVETPYSGMLPGLLAGHYDRAAAHVDLRPLCRFADARLYHASVERIDPLARLVHARGRPPIAYDLLSIDIGSSPDGGAIRGVEAAFPVKPVDEFLARWAEVEGQVLEAGNDTPFRLLVIGAGAGGVELALALHWRLARALRAQGGDPARLRFTIAADQPAPLPTHAPSVRRRMAGLLAARGIGFVGERSVTALEDGVARLAPGGEIPFDAAVLTTHAKPAPWLGETGLALDDAGFLAVGPTLQSISHANVFAAGDIAAFEAGPLPKSGVYAVRQGPYLAENLRRLVQGRPARPYPPQKRALALMSGGARHAVASYGSLSLQGDWVWRLKDWIDRRWMAKYQDLPSMAGRDGEEGALAMRCGGCGAKVASPVLNRVLARLKAGPDGRAIDLEQPDDAAVIRTPASGRMLQTVDHFRAFIDDPYVFGRIAANHCMSDIFAMGGQPTSALAIVTLPFAAEEKLEADLEALLAGALRALAEAGARLIGGHTAEGPELAFGLTVNGEIETGAPLRKGGAAAGEVLILTKPLGTGAILAADMAGEASSAWVEAALDAMVSSGGPAARILVDAGASAMTDVTGFGLLGHLIEMLKASGTTARLDLRALPALPGASELLARGIASTLHPANEAFAEVLAPGAPTDPLLFDPQTAGGLLASLPAGRAADALARLAAAGHARAAVIGEIGPAPAPGEPLVGLGHGAP